MKGKHRVRLGCRPAPGKQKRQKSQRQKSTLSRPSEHHPIVKDRKLYIPMRRTAESPPAHEMPRQLPLINPTAPRRSNDMSILRGTEYLVCFKFCHHKKKY